MDSLNKIAMEILPNADQLKTASASEQTSKSAATAITQTSKTLIRLQPSKLNPGEVIGDIIDRFRQGIGWNLKDEQTPEARAERKRLIAIFLEQLGAGGVPVEQYERCYRRATATRARRRADGKENPFHITPEELVSEWFLLKKERENQTSDEKPDLETCTDANNHIEGEAVQEYLIWGSYSVYLPCHVCRPKTHQKRQLEAVEVRNNSFANRRLEAGEEDHA